MKTKQPCPICKGKGYLPPLGMEGLSNDNPARRDVMRHFQRSCKMEDGGCDGIGWRWVEVSVLEGNTGAQMFGLQFQQMFERLRKRL